MKTPPRIENYNNNGAPIFERDAVYAFLLKGTLTDEQGTAATRYWRLNIAQNSVLNGHPVATHQILRNAIYSTNIRTVLTSGYNTPEEAEIMMR
ncbi:MAG: hypothetical protein LIO97_04030 [Tannerellaceae bacterium]|nr:hypothetical protein [Tannerellaceae bacterium]